MPRWRVFKNNRAFCSKMYALVCAVVEHEWAFCSKGKILLRQGCWHEGAFCTLRNFQKKWISATSFHSLGFVGNFCYLDNWVATLSSNPKGDALLICQCAFRLRRPAQNGYPALGPFFGDLAGVSCCTLEGPGDLWRSGPRSCEDPCEKIRCEDFHEIL
jgi:hypothetical protein